MRVSYIKNHGQKLGDAHASKYPPIISWIIRIPFLEYRVYDTHRQEIREALLKDLIEETTKGLDQAGFAILQKVWQDAINASSFVSFQFAQGSSNFSRCNGRVCLVICDTFKGAIASPAFARA